MKDTVSIILLVIGWLLVEDSQFFISAVFILAAFFVQVDSRLDQIKKLHQNNNEND